MLARGAPVGRFLLGDEIEGAHIGVEPRRDRELDPVERLLSFLASHDLEKLEAVFRMARVAREREHDPHECESRLARRL